MSRLPDAEIYARDAEIYTTAGNPAEMKIFSDLGIRELPASGTVVGRARLRTPECSRGWPGKTFAKVFAGCTRGHLLLSYWGPGTWVLPMVEPRAILQSSPPFVGD